MLVEHHTKYKEIHGVDETVWMEISEHTRLHRRLRKEGKCNIPAEELKKISQQAYLRTTKNRGYSQHPSKDFFLDNIGIEILLKLLERSMRPYELEECIKTTTPRMHRMLSILIKMRLVSREELFHQRAKYTVLYSLKDDRAKVFVKALRRFMELQDFGLLEEL